MTALPSALWLLALAMVAIRSAEVFYVPIMPLYVRLLDATVPLFVVGLATSVDRLGAVVINPVAGRWADRAGRRRPYLIGVGLTAVASALGGLAVGVVDLVAYRLVSGIGYGTLTIAAMSYVSEITSTKNRATAMSIFSASTLAGAALGPFPGGYIAEAFTPALTGYRNTFFAGGLLELLVGAYAFLMIREHRRAAGSSRRSSRLQRVILRISGSRALSAGTAPGGRVHPEVVDVMREVGIDLAGARPQRLTDELAGAAQVLITMGCGEACPVVPGLKRDDWPIEAPKGRPDRDCARDPRRDPLAGRAFGQRRGLGLPRALTRRPG